MNESRLVLTFLIMLAYMKLTNENFFRPRPPEMKDFPQVLSTFLIASFDISRQNGFMGKVKSADYKSNSAKFLINGKVFNKFLTDLETS